MFLLFLCEDRTAGGEEPAAISKEKMNRYWSMNSAKKELGRAVQVTASLVSAVFGNLRCKISFDMLK